MDRADLGLVNDRIPSDIELATIAQAIGYNWEILGIQLGLNKATIDQIKMDNHATATQIFRMMQVWKQAKADTATLTCLYKAMENSHSLTINRDALPGVPPPFPHSSPAAESDGADKSYIQLKRQLKLDLIDFNWEQLGTTAISPVHEQSDAPLLELYVPPTIARVGQRVGARSENNSTEQATTLHEIFHEHTKRCQQIYISAEAGLGKTVFAKRLALIWCTANDPNSEHAAHDHQFSDEELNAMRDFEFVLFVSLRDIDPSDCRIDDMIQNQVINYLPKASRYSREFMEDVLSQESCLIILDGLDEWSHPAIGDCKMRMSERKSNVPHKQSRKTCTFLTTTRPWKLIFANISMTKIDQQFEIVGLDKGASEKLRNKVTEKLKGNADEGDFANSERDVDNGIEQKIESIKRNPMLIMYLACLQNEDRGFGNSMCELYSNILEMMLQRADPEEVADSLPEVNLPGCFGENEYCQSYASVLKELGHLAFATLFNSKGDSRLVFSSLQAKGYMSEAHFNLWLRSGILTHAGVNKPLTKRQLQVSFVHKMFHDFFAALYMCMEQSKKPVEEVLNTCKHVNDILEMKNTFVFLSGFSSDRSNAVLSRLTTVVSGDTLAASFRYTTYPFLDYWELCDLMEEFQNMMVDCVNESTDNQQQADYNVEDIIIQSKPGKKYMSALKQLLGNVKLLKLGRLLLPEDVHDLLEEFNLFQPQSLQSIEKLDIWGAPHTEDIDRLLKGSSKTLKCLLLHGCKMVDNKETEAYIHFSGVTITILQNLENLESIDLFSIEMKHQQIDELVDWLEQRKCMTQIKLSRIKCSDHGNYVRGSLKDYIKCKARKRPFDLSGHEHLTILGLGTMGMPSVNVRASSLEECWMEQNEGLIMNFLSTVVPSSAMLHTLVIEFVKDPDVVQAISKLLPQLSRLRHLQMKCIDFLGMDLVLTQRDTLKHVRLIEITMTVTTLKKLVDFFKTCNKSVTTEISSCVTQSENEAMTYETLKKEIENSREFEVLPNMRCSGHDNAFAFKTLVSHCH